MTDPSEYQLVTAQELLPAAFEKMVLEYARFGTPFLGMFSGQDYASFARMCAAHEHGKNLPKGITPYTRYFLTDKQGTIYAQGDVRHAPNRNLTYFSGYLGYGVVPPYRRNGFGTLMCARLLEKARAHHYKSVIITCNTDNIASAKIIEKNGGKLLDIRYWGKQNAFMKRYLVNLE